MKKDKSSWIVGGGFLTGLGIGFFLLPNGLAFVGSMIIGLGIGLLLTGIFSK